MKLNRKTKIAAGLVLGLTAAGVLTGCVSEADRSSKNLSNSAEHFELNRRIILFNGITDKYLLVVEGRCSVENAESALGPNSVEITCKVGPDQYKKHYGGLSDNVSYFVEQLDSKDVSVYHYQVRLKPESLIPDIRIEGGKQ